MTMDEQLKLQLLQLYNKFIQDNFNTLLTLRKQLNEEFMADSKTALCVGLVLAFISIVFGVIMCGSKKENAIIDAITFISGAVSFFALVGAWALWMQTNNDISSLIPMHHNLR